MDSDEDHIEHADLEQYDTIHIKSNPLIYDDFKELEEENGDLDASPYAMVNDNQSPQSVHILNGNEVFFVFFSLL